VNVRNYKFLVFFIISYFKSIIVIVCFIKEYCSLELSNEIPKYPSVYMFKSEDVDKHYMKFEIQRTCIVIYSYNESQRDALFLKFI
jgi:hypothetical protein